MWFLLGFFSQFYETSQLAAFVFLGCYVKKKEKKDKEKLNQFSYSQPKAH